MHTSFEQDAMLLDDVLLLYNACGDVVRIPAQLSDGSRVRVVGENAIGPVKRPRPVRSMFVAEGVEEIRTQKYVQPERLTLPTTVTQADMHSSDTLRCWRRLTQSQWAQLMGGSRPIRSGGRVVTSREALKLLPVKLDSTAQKTSRTVISWFPEGVPALMRIRGDRLSLNRAMPVETMPLDGEADWATVEDGLLSAVTGQTPTVTDPAAERMKDALLRSLEPLPALNLQGIVVSVDPPAAVSDTGEWLVCFTLQSGRWCYPSMRTIRMEGREFRLACLHLMTSGDLINLEGWAPYLRVEMGVYEGTVRVTDEALLKRIYERYLFLSLL